MSLLIQSSWPSKRLAVAAIVIMYSMIAIPGFATAKSRHAKRKCSPAQEVGNQRLLGYVRIEVSAFEDKTDAWLASEVVRGVVQSATEDKLQAKQIDQIVDAVREAVNDVETIGVYFVSTGTQIRVCVELDCASLEAIESLTAEIDTAEFSAALAKEVKPWRKQLPPFQVHVDDEQQSVLLSFSDNDWTPRLAKLKEQFEATRDYQRALAGLGDSIRSMKSDNILATIAFDVRHWQAIWAQDKDVRRLDPFVFVAGYLGITDEGLRTEIYCPLTAQRTGYASLLHFDDVDTRIPDWVPLQTMTYSLVDFQESQLAAAKQELNEIPHLLPQSWAIQECFWKEQQDESTKQRVLNADGVTGRVYTLRIASREPGVNSQSPVVVVEFQNAKLARRALQAYAAERELLEKLNKHSTRQGEYDWCLSLLQPAMFVMSPNNFNSIGHNVFPPSLKLPVWGVGPAFCIIDRYLVFACAEEPLLAMIEAYEARELRFADAYEQKLARRVKQPTGEQLVGVSIIDVQQIVQAVQRVMTDQPLRKFTYSYLPLPFQKWHDYETAQGQRVTDELLKAKMSKSPVIWGRLYDSGNGLRLIHDIQSKDN